jgi:hypothetical protein
MVTHDHHTLSKGEFKSNAGGHFSQAPPGHSSLAPKSPTVLLQTPQYRKLGKSHPALKINQWFMAVAVCWGFTLPGKKQGRRFRDAN